MAGSKPSISATRSAVLGSILPYVMKIACRAHEWSHKYSFAI